MKPIVKKVLIGTALTVGVLSYLAYSKVEKLKRIFDQLIIRPKNIKEFKASFKQISFVTDILFINPTTETFNVSGYVADLTRLNFFYGGKYIGTAKPVVNEITIPAKNELLFKNIPVVLSTTTILENINTIASFDFNNLEVEAVINIAGNEYYIK